MMGRVLSLPFVLPHDHLRWFFLSMSDDGDTYPCKIPRLHAFGPHLCDRRDMAGRIQLGPLLPEEFYWPGQDPYWYQGGAARAFVLEYPVLLAVGCCSASLTR